MLCRLLFVVVLHQLVAGLTSSRQCTTPGCIHFAKSIKENMDKTVDPCVDFHEFTCGHWSKNNPNPRDRDKRDIFQMMSTIISEKLIDTLNDDSDSSRTTKAYQKAKKMYQNCMDLEAIERNGVEAILSRLRSTGGWPVMMPLQEWSSKTVNLSQIHGYYVRELDLAPFYAIYAFPDSENSSINKLHIDATFYTPFKDILRTHDRNSSKVLQYADKIIKVVNILANATGNIVNVADVLKDVNDLIDFEQTLAKLIPDPSAGADIDRRRNLMTVDDLQTWYNERSRSKNSMIVWIDLLRNVLQDTEIYFTDKNEVIFTEKDFTANVIKLLDDTPIRTIVNYIQWDFINEVLVAAPKDLENISFELSQLKTDVTAPEGRNITCAHLLGFQHAIGHEFVQHHFTPDTRSKANEIITEIIEATDQVLRQTSWLNANELQFVRDKLSTIIRFIGYPEWYNDPANIDNYYQECDINDTFLDNIIEVRRFENNLKFRRLAKPVDKTEFQGNPTQFNAHYAPAANAIRFTSAMLQIPIFSSDYPSVFQYAIFGAIAGHEISHAFDAVGAKFDKNGNRVEWWSNETKNIFHSRVDCFVKQYDNYTIYRNENITVNARGDLTKTENIADLHGLKLAYTAYENIKTREDENLRLPGLESYNDKQLFFLAFATLWCSSANQAYYINQARHNWHSVPRLRTIGTLSNMEEFSTAFNCPATANMNPQNKCVIWGADRTVQQN